MASEPKKLLIRQNASHSIKVTAFWNLDAGSFNLLFCNRSKCPLFVSPLKISIDKRVHYRRGIKNAFLSHLEDNNFVDQ